MHAISCISVQPALGSTLKKSSFAEGLVSMSAWWHQQDLLAKGLLNPNKAKQLGLEVPLVDEMPEFAQV